MHKMYGTYDLYKKEDTLITTHGLLPARPCTSCTDRDAPWALAEQGGGAGGQVTSQAGVRALENDFGIRVIPIFFLVLILIIVVATAAADGSVRKRASLPTNVGRRGSSHRRSPQSGSARAGVGQTAGRSSGRKLWRLRTSG